MTSLQTVVLGLVIVFLDIPPDGYDWIADPLGWLLVLLGLGPLAGHLPNQRGLVVTAAFCLLFSVVSWPEGSPATLTPLLGWLFSLPTLAWCFLVCDAVGDAVEGRLRTTALSLRVAFAVAAPLPGLVYLADQDWLSTPAEVIILVANVALLFVLWSASSRPGLAPVVEEAAGATEASRRPTGRRSESSDDDAPPPAKPKPRAKTVGFSAEEAKRRARARRDKAERSSGSARSGASTRTTKPAPTTADTTGRSARQERDRETDPETPVTGAEVIEKVRRRRRAREQAKAREASED